MTTIRTASLADADDIARLSAELGYPNTADQIRERLTVFTGRADYITLVAIVDNQMAGWIQGCALITLESGLRAQIVGLVVAKEFRRCGVGRALVDAIEHWAVANGANVIVVRSNTQRAESHHFYPSVGYTNSKTQLVYRQDLK